MDAVANGMRSQALSVPRRHGNSLPSSSLSPVSLAQPTGKRRRMCVSSQCLFFLLLVAMQTGASAETDGFPRSLAPMLERVLPAAVGVKARWAEKRDASVPTLPSTETKTKVLTEQASGSGVVIDARQGLVITSAHTIDGAVAITVRLSDGRELEARLLGLDRGTDIAALEISPDGLVSLPVGSSANLRAGDFVIAIGSPFDLDATATAGMVSSVRRSSVGFRHFESYIQHDAAVNSGNSGGALVTLDGDLIGINTAILSPSAGNVGIGFAIPSGMALRIFNQLVTYGQVRRGNFGLITEDIPEQSVAKGTFGARIRSIEPGSPAQTSGLLVGDLVVAVFDAPVRRKADLDTRVAVAEVGETAQITVHRGQEQLSFAVKIAAVIPTIEKLQINVEGSPLMGAVVESGILDATAGEVRGVGVVFVEPNSPSALAGLLVGDRIKSIGKQRVRTMADVDTLSRIIRDPVHVVRGDEELTLPIANKRQ